jgi:hypothetical protein
MEEGCAWRGAIPDPTGVLVIVGIELGFFRRQHSHSGLGARNP